MRLLIDTNIVLEIILEQERAREARSLLSLTEEHVFFLSDFSLHSVGVLLFRRRQQKTYWEIIEDLVFNGGMAVISLSVDEMESVVKVAERFELDFDDAYQYVASEKHQLAVVSFDGDFDRTERGRQTPAAVMGTG
ncbi:MAG TPA: PIN domain-containing protein [Dehalococcoidia bacterium]|nr:PIN domain-containing protein [Dehalococcoidia bacterium]